MDFKLLLIGIISLTICVYIYRGRYKREEKENIEIDGTFRYNYTIVAIGLCALFLGFFSLLAFFYRWIY